MAEQKKETAKEPEWAALAAIDWADRKHFWRLAPSGCDRQEHGEMENTPEAVDVWAMALHQRFGGRPVAVCLEQSRGSLVCLLGKYPHLVLFPVHPNTAAQYRETFHPSGAKSDSEDTASLLDLLQRHRERLSPLRPDTEATPLLQTLVETRRRLVDEKTRCKNRLTACLKIYFPQVLKWFDEVDSALVAALLRRWPTLMELQRARPKTLAAFFCEHNCRCQERIRERLDAISEAMPATTDAAIVEGESFKAHALVEVIATLRIEIQKHDERIAELMKAHPDARLFQSLPGAGPALAPRLVVAFGTRRDRFQNAEEMQRLSGIAPVTVSSGNTKCVHMRRACPKFLRQTFQEFAEQSRRRSEWAEAFYVAERRQNKSHHTALRALAYKWIRIIFRCWKDGQPYDEQLYMRSLDQRNSPLIRSFQLNTCGEWKPVAGFQKFCELPS